MPPASVGWYQFSDWNSSWERVVWKVRGLWANWIVPWIPGYKFVSEKHLWASLSVHYLDIPIEHKLRLIHIIIIIYTFSYLPVTVITGELSMSSNTEVSEEDSGLVELLAILVMILSFSSA